MSYKDALPMPDIDLLRAKFDLDADNGALIRRQTYHGFKAGEIAGYLRPCGYRFIKLDGKTYAAHRIIYFMATGTDPGLLMIDHINGQPDDNRLCNLRLADIKQNGRHRANNLSNNKSGHRGVWENKTTGRWHVSVYLNGKSLQRACDTKEEAARLAASLRAEHYGEFAGVAA